MLDTTIDIQNQQSLLIGKIIEVDELSQSQIKHTWLRTQKNNLPTQIQANEVVKQIISNPLLLTLLRIVFEETGEVPADRVQLYNAGLQIILKHWDLAKDVEDESDKNMSIKQKEGLLSYIAWMTYSDGEYFFKQQQLEQYIIQYIQNISTTKISSEDLKQRSQQILKSIQAQYKIFHEWTPGVYAFSVLSFHEYLAAKAIVEEYTFQGIEQSLKLLVEQLTENRWHQIYILVAHMLPNADYLLLLMKYKIDAFINMQPTLQPFLNWLEHKSLTKDAVYKPAAVRAFHIECLLDVDSAISCSLDNNLARDLEADSLDLHYSYKIKNCRFSDRQKQVLRQYYDMSKVLFNSIEAGRVTDSLREELEHNLFLPNESIYMVGAIA